MASLLSLIRDGKIHPPSSEIQGPSELDELYKRILHHDTIHISAHRVAEEVLAHLGEEVDLREDFQDVTPPFRYVWIEALLGEGRCGCLVSRLMPPSQTEIDQLFAGVDQIGPDDDCGHFVRHWLFIDIKGSVLPFAKVQALTDRYGQIVRASGASYHSSITPEAVQVFMRVVWEAFCRMNTQGAVLVECPGSRVEPRRKHRPLEGRACIWREVIIRPEKTVVVGGLELPTEEASERREHWVRGHRKDYRKGGGLFGHVKAIVWIPEYKRGSAALGCEIPEYIIRTA